MTLKRILSALLAMASLVASTSKADDCAITQRASDYDYEIQLIHMIIPRPYVEILLSMQSQEQTPSNLAKLNWELTGNWPWKMQYQYRLKLADKIYDLTKVMDASADQQVHFSDSPRIKIPNELIADDSVMFASLDVILNGKHFNQDLSILLPTSGKNMKDFVKARKGYRGLDMTQGIDLRDGSNVFILVRTENIMKALGELQLGTDSMVFALFRTPKNVAGLRAKAAELSTAKTLYSATAGELKPPLHIYPESGLVISSNKEDPGLAEDLGAVQTSAIRSQSEDGNCVRPVQYRVRLSESAVNHLDRYSRNSQNSDEAETKLRKALRSCTGTVTSINFDNQECTVQYDKNPICEDVFAKFDDGIKMIEQSPCFYLKIMESQK